MLPLPISTCCSKRRQGAAPSAIPLHTLATISPTPSRPTRQLACVCVRIGRSSSTPTAGVFSVPPSHLQHTDRCSLSFSLSPPLRIRRRASRSFSTEHQFWLGSVCRSLACRSLSPQCFRSNLARTTILTLFATLSTVPPTTQPIRSHCASQIEIYRHSVGSPDSQASIFFQSCTAIVISPNYCLPALEHLPTTVPPVSSGVPSLRRRSIAN